MLDSYENRRFAYVRRSRGFLFAYLVVLDFCCCCKAFSIQWNVDAGTPGSTRRIRPVVARPHKKDNASNLISRKYIRIRRCEMKLYENSVVSLHDESNLSNSTEREGYIFQSQDNTHNDQMTNVPMIHPLTPPVAGVNITATAAMYVPMSDLQITTLKEKITKYIIPITTDVNGDMNRPAVARKFITLWRNLIDDTPELAGYPISFLSEQMNSIMLSTTSSTTQGISLNYLGNDATIDWDFILPYIDAYTFEVGGGVSGLVYGVNGVADGTRICTTSVIDVQSTIPRNYIQTGDGCLYELGRPAFLNDCSEVVSQTEQSYSLTGTTKEWFRNGKEAASTLMVKNSKPIIDDRSNKITTVDPDLLQLAGLTTLVLSGAMAMETLSHHLTLNVFWV